MAKVTMTLKVRISWWVRPYMALALTFAWISRPFLSNDDIEHLAHAVASTVAEKGIHLVAE